LLYPISTAFPPRAETAIASVTATVATISSGDITNFTPVTAASVFLPSPANRSWAALLVYFMHFDEHES
jgi:hypothetical protein